MSATPGRHLTHSTAEPAEPAEPANGPRPAARRGRRGQRGWNVRAGFNRALMAVVQATFLGSMLIATPLGVAPVLAANPSADLDQCANGPAPSPASNGCNPDEWVNGNLGASKSVYYEGDSIPYRMKFDNLDLASSHVVIIEWDTTKSGKHAIDYLTTWNRTVLDADPCVDVSGCSTSTTFPIPVDPQVSGAGVTPVAGNFTLFGGTITSVSAYSYPVGSGFAGDKSAQIAITFTADVVNPVLAWGGHIASRQDWGLSNSAVAIPGSPYHMRLIDLDGAGGNQDRSLSAAAVIFPASITIIKQATPEGSTSFPFTASPAPLSNFSLVDDGTSANTKVFSGIVDFQTYTVTESVPSGWGLTNRACETTSPNGGSTANSGSFGVSITLEEGENVTCTFSNGELPNPSLDVTKTVTSVNADDVAPFLVTAAGDVITYEIVVSNTGNVALHGVSINDPLLGNEDCDGVAGAPYVSTGFTIAVGGSLTCTGTYTVTQADIDNNGGGDGDIDNTVTADSDETGPDTASATVPLSQSPSLSITKVATESGFDSVGDVIHYTITVTNTGNVTLHDVAVTDAQVSDLDCDGVAGAPLVTTGFTIGVGGSLTCSASHTIVQADLNAGSFYNQACADDGPGGAASDCDDVTTPGDQSPALSISKVATESSFDSVGDVIHYTITVTNTGNVTLHDVDVTDPNVSDLDCTPATPVADLAPGASITCTASHTIVQADLDAGSFFNQACADDGPGGATSDCDDVTTPGDQNPSLSITKVATESGFDSVGDVIHYTITATNDGNVTLHDVVVTDAQVSDLDCTPTTPVADLAPGATIDCTASHTVTQADLDAGSFYNQACVDDANGAASTAAAPDCDDVTTPGDQNPSLTITKVATEDGFDSVGDVIHYTITATNDGNVTLHDVDVTDPNVSDLDCTPATPVVDLAPGATIDCTASHTVTQADLDAGSFYNQACVDDGDGGADSACDDVTTPGDQNPHLSITKVDDVESFDSVGDVIGYTITATNDGNVTLHDVVVTDPNVSDLDCTPTTPVADLAPGATIDCTASHTIVQADLDAGSFYNQACVDDGDGGADSACDDVTTPGDQSPSLAIEKVATESGFDAVDDVIHYTITATNDGNVTLHDVVVTDAQVGDLDCTPDTPVADLAPGASITCTASHTIVQADIDEGSFWNQACTDDGSGDGATGAAAVCDDVTTPGSKNPHLSITKVDDVESFDSVGDVIHYTITATNDGNVTLHDVVVTDPNVSDLDCTPTTPVADLAPGASITCTASHTITQEDLDAGSFYNQACVDDGDGGAESQCDDVTTPGDQSPHLSITKVDDVDAFDSVGDVIHYTITATNDGNVTLHNVNVTDPNVGDLDCTPDTPVADLAPGASITCTASHTVTQEDLDAGFVYNQACVSDGEAGATDVCDDVTTPGDQNPLLGITKVAAEPDYDEVGDVIHYTITATNIGNVTLHDVVITDPNVSDLSCTPDLPVADLAVGASITCTATHTVVLEDFDTAVFNQACADDDNGAEDSGAAPVCDDVTTFGQLVGGETSRPTQPATDSTVGGGRSRPSEAAWLLVIALAGLLGALLLVTPARRRRQI